MDKEQLEAQSRAAIKAWCDDPSVQLELMLKGGSEWISKITKLWFDLDAYYYRIAKPKKWYRVAEMRDGTTVTADYFLPEENIRGRPGFVKWLDEMRYYD